MDRLTVFIAAVGLAVIASAIASIPVFLLWNACLVGAVVGINEITWLQGWGITLLCKSLFHGIVEAKK